MVQTAVADIVGPTVAAEDPHGLLGQVFLLAEDISGQRAGGAVAQQGALGLQLGGVRGELRHGGQLLHGADALLQGLDVGLGGLGVGGAVVHGVQPRLCGGLQLGTRPLHSDQLAGLVGQILADLVLTGEHTQAVLGVILEQGVAPGGTVAGLVGAVGRRSRGTAPDGGAAGGVGDIHMVAEQLGDETGVAGLGAAGAGAGELQHGLLELAALDGVVLHILLLGHLGHAVVEHVLLGQLALLGDHGQGVHRAGADADAAAHAVQRADGHGELIGALALAGLDIHDLGSLGGLGGLVSGEGEGTDGGVGADVGALVALDALLGVPGGDGDGHAALLIGGGAQLELAVHMVHEGGDGQAVAVHLAHGLQDILDHLHQLGLALELLGGLGVHGVGPVGGHVDLLIGGGAQIDGLVVHVNDVLALLQVGGLGLLLHVGDGLLLGHDLGQREERGLEDGVVALTHADLDGQVNGIDGVELDVVLGDIALGGGVHVVVQLVEVPLAVDHVDTAGLDILHHLEALGHVAGVVAGHEVSLVDIIRAADGVIAEAQVADGHAAGLLGVVLEVRLDVLVGVVADDLDGVLVGADGTVAAQTPELALDGAGGRGVGTVLILGQREVGHIVHDADGELTLHLVLLQLVIHGEHGGGRRVLAAQAVTAADDLHIVPAGVGQRGDNVLIQRLALRAGLLGAVQHGDLPHGGGQRLDELLSGEGAEQAHLHQTHLLAVGVQVVDDLLGHVADGAHGHDDAVSVGGAVVVEQLIVGAQLGVDLVHVLLHHGGQGGVVAVAGLAVLEEDVAVLVAAAHMGMLGVQGVLAELGHGVHVAHILQVLVVPDSDLLDLVGGAEAVEEVDEGDLALQRGQMGHGGQIHDLLDVALAQHGEAGLAAGHDVGVVAEDV